MKKTFRKLRQAMFCAEPPILQEDLAKELNCSLNHVSRLMNCRADWSAMEMYTVMELLGAPDEELHEYFPRKDAML